MKKRLALLLAITLLFCFSACSSPKNETGQKTDFSVSVFNTLPVKNPLFETIDEITYDYSLTPAADNPNKATVVLVFTMKFNGKVYSASGIDTVDAVRSASGKILWHGPIDGTAQIEGTTCKFIAGFSKLDAKEAVQIDVNLNFPDPLVGVYPFSFGEVIFTEEVSAEFGMKTK